MEDLSDYNFGKIEGKAEETEESQELLYIILMMSAAVYLNTFLEGFESIRKWSHLYQRENGIAMLIGICGGLYVQKTYEESLINNFLYSQAILFKLFLVPPIIYEMVMNFP